MRNVVLGLGISLDGYIAREDGSVDWLSTDWDYDWGAFMGTIDTVLMGRGSWLKMLEMTGGLKQNPYKGLRTCVFSRTLEAIEADGVELVGSPIAPFVRELKRTEGKKIWLSGGGCLAASFLEEDLVDELHLGVTPVLLGSGIRLFQSFGRQLDLRLKANNTCYNRSKNNAMVELAYDVVRGGVEASEAKM